MRKAALLAVLFPAILQAQQIKPRILFDVDTSGSMGWWVCDSPTTVDDTVDCPGVDVDPCEDCPGAVGCENGLADDGRLWKVKKAIRDVVTAFGEVEFGLARFHMDPVTWSCPQGGWEGANDFDCFVSPLGTGDNAADILVKFDDDNRTQNLLEWIDLETNTAGTPLPTGCNLCDDCGGGCDKELRPQGATPVAGSIVSCRNYINDIRGGDPQKDCRPYAMIVLSDGQNNCDDPANPGVDPTARVAGETCAAGIPVHVIGFATPILRDLLNEIAEEGCNPDCWDLDGDGVLNCTPEAVIVEDENKLALAFADIIQSSIRVELCNGKDDDCDGETDEDFVTLGTPCGRGRCAGEVCCDDSDPMKASTKCCGLGPTCEDCNRIDDDCDGRIDEPGDIDRDCDGVPDVNQICLCFPEECNGIDDDCDCDPAIHDLDGDGVCGPGDINVDEEPLATSGLFCGSDIGVCQSGVTCCEDSAPACCGGVLPKAEVCDCKDNDCNGFTDEASNVPCFTLGDGCDPLTGLCKGICVLGHQECRDQDPGPECVPGAGPCLGQRGPDEEMCNCVDDDCDGETDEDVICEGGGVCENCTCPLNCDPKLEFPCRAGFNCECIADAADPPEGQEPCECDQNAADIGDCLDNFFCQVDVCLGVECEDCFFCDARAGGVCKSTCEEFIQCQDWEQCVCDVCVDFSCTNPQNPDAEKCSDEETCDPDLHECVRDPCLDIECPEDEYCRSDDICTDGPEDFCVPACPDCGEEQTCECGECVDDACANQDCLPNQVCCEGECRADPCITLECAPGKRCDACNGACLPDNCALGRIRCPSGFVCTEDQCISRREADPGRRTISVSGAGGCSCRVASSPATPEPPWPVMLLGMAVAFVRRRR